MRLGEKFMKYANRSTEYEQVKNLLADKVNPIFIDAYRASGVTSFIQEKMADVYTPAFNKQNILYIDATTDKPLSEMIFEKLIHSDHIKQLQVIADKKLGKHDNSLFQALLETVNYGPLLSRLMDRKSALPVYSGNYSSAMEAHLIPFFNDDHCTPFLIIIDAVEQLPGDSHDFLARLLRCKSVQCILIKTEDTPLYDKIENYLSARNIDVTSHVLFERPQIKLIKELGSLYDVEVSTPEAEKIVTETEQNIHAIIKHIRNLKCSPIHNSFTAWEKTIISILKIWGSAISETNLIEIATASNVFAEDSASACQIALSSLKEKCVISDNGVGWELSTHYDPEITKITDSVADQLICKNIVYRFLCERGHEKINTKLRYQLSRDLNCTTAEDAKLFLRQQIMLGNDVSADVMSYANLDKTKREDCLLAAIKYCRERKNDEALNWISFIPENKITDDIEAFRAVLLSRTRHSVEAESALISSLKKSDSPEQQNLLAAFLINNYTQMEDLSKAQLVYERTKDLYPLSSTHGYLVRNATSAFKGYPGNMYEIALSDFEADNDDYGYYTTLCNQGYALCKIGDYVNARSLLEQAQKGLENFPQTNLHIIYNDLGICYLLLDKFEEAVRYLRLAIDLSQNKMPQIFATINLACAEAVMGHTDHARLSLDEIYTDVRNYTLDRVRQKYYPNRLLVEYLAGNKDMIHLIESAKSFPDRYFPEQTKKAINLYQRFANSNKAPQKHRWKELFSPCGLTYWYVDPLKLLPAGII